MSQTTYNFNPAIARHGMVAEEREGNIIQSKLCQTAVGVGRLVANGTNGQRGMSTTTADPLSTTPGSVVPFVEAETDPIADTQFVGVPIYDSSRAPYNSSNQYVQYESVPVMRKGVIWILVPDAAVTEYGDVYVYADPDGATTYEIGTFLAGANAGTGIKFTRGRWLTSTSGANGLAVLEIW